jgi:hypothetical protein
VEIRLELAVLAAVELDLVRLQLQQMEQPIEAAVAVAVHKPTAISIITAVTAVRELWS